MWPFFNKPCLSDIWHISLQRRLLPCSLCVVVVYTLAQVFGVEGELSEIARQGSGSACRSMYGGFVQWIMGEEDNGKDSLAQQVAPETHWPELRVLVLVVGQFECFLRETDRMMWRLILALLWKSDVFFIFINERFFLGQRGEEASGQHLWDADQCTNKPSLKGTPINSQLFSVLTRQAA